MRTQARTVLVNCLGSHAMKQISVPDKATTACQSLICQISAKSVKTIVSDDLRDAAGGLANRLRRLVRATRSAGL